MLPIIEAFKSKISQECFESTRVFHGRGGCFPGLEQVCLDFFQGIVLITLFKEHPDNFIGDLLDQLRELPEFCKVDGVYVQHRYKHKAPGEVIYGEVPDQWLAIEDGLNYRIRFGKSQNTGFFLDMSNGRQWIREHSAGKRILNLFSYTCSFSVAAMAGGAESIINLDMSTGALKLGKENHKLNGFDSNQAKYWQHDIFKSWSKIRRNGPYDIIIVDPPSAQRGSFVAEKDYPRVVKRLSEFLNEGGMVLAALNAPYLDSDFLPQIFAENWPEATLVRRLPNPGDFPESDPDKSLKVFIFQK